MSPLLNKDCDIDKEGIAWVRDANVCTDFGLAHNVLASGDVERFAAFVDCFPHANLNLRSREYSESVYSFDVPYPLVPGFLDSRIPVKPEAGATPLHIAVTMGFAGVSIVRMINLGCCVDATTLKYGWNALMIASAAGNDELVRELFWRTKDIYRKDELCWTAAHFLGANGKEVLLELFPADMLQMRDFYGLTPIDLACMNANKITTTTTSASRSTVGEMSVQHRAVSDCVFFMMLERGSWDLEQRLLDLAPRLASWYFQSNDGVTPLMVAVRRKFLGLFSLILSSESGVASIDLQDRSGRTALHDACDCRAAENIRMLLFKGASHTLRDASGANALLLYLRSTSSDECDDEVLLFFVVFLFP